MDTFDPEPRIEVPDALKALRSAEGARGRAEEALMKMLKGVGYAAD